MTINAKVLKTTTFRLVAIYLLVFMVSTGAILAYIFWNTAVLMERQTEETIRAEVQALGDQYRLRDLQGVVDVIARRISSETGTLYLLVNPANERIIGNLTGLSGVALKDASWVDFPILVGKPPQQARHMARAYHVQLEGGYALTVGRDVEELRAFRNLIRRSLIWAIGLTLFLGVGGGLLMSRNFLRRVDAITAASRSIMAGDLSQRMPIEGTDDELDRLAQSLNEMLGQIERLMAGMKEVSSNVAHDLRTPLTRLRARAEDALRNGNPDEQRAALQQTLVESDNLLKTFAALLSIARAESGSSREGLMEVDAAAIINDVAELYEPLVEDAGGALHCNLEGPLRVRADRQLLAQAITNLLDNAMKYGAAAKTGEVTISISGRSEGGMARIAIADSGSGIRAEDRQRVLERFVRLDESRTKPGSGLGLSLVASVVKLHGGKLTLQDAAPGLEAIIELPLVA